MIFPSMNVRRLLKRFSSLVFSTLLAMACCAPYALAADASSQFHGDYVVSKSANVTDTAALKKLEKKAKSLSEKYEFGVYLYYSGLKDSKIQKSKNVKSALKKDAKRIWNKYDLGKGADSDGILLYCHPRLGAYVIFGSDSYALVFSDTEISEMKSYIAYDVDNGEWVAAGQDYLVLADTALDCYYEYGTVEGAAGSDQSGAAKSGSTKNGTSTDSVSAQDKQTYAKHALIAGSVVGLIIAIVVFLALRFQLKSVYKGRDADFYAQGGVNITERNEIFLGTTVTRVKKPQVNDNGRGMF